MESPDTLKKLDYILERHIGSYGMYAKIRLPFERELPSNSAISFICSLEHKGVTTYA
jgi:hypothetical protein